MLSAADWQLQLVSELVSALTSSTQGSSPPEPQQIHRTLLSASRTLSQLQSHQAHLLATIVLKRRDSFIGSTTSLPEEHSSRLRTSPIDASYLFSQEAVDEATRRAREEAERITQASLSRFGSNRNPQRSNSSNRGGLLTAPVGLFGPIQPKLPARPFQAAGWKGQATVAASGLGVGFARSWRVVLKHQARRP